MFKPWIFTNAGRCWSCDELSSFVVQMFIAPDGQRACEDCLITGNANYNAYYQGYKDGTEAFDPLPHRDLTDHQVGAYQRGYHDGLFSAS